MTDQLAENAELILRAKGPLTGAMLQDRLGADILKLWRACSLSPNLQIRHFGRRYLRLDHCVEGEARLSPSIRREFLTYSIIFHLDQASDADHIATCSTDYIAFISLRKRELAADCVKRICEQCPPSITDHTVFLLAGDIVYNMAHDVPRPEFSTGKMVCGSDLDVIIVYDDAINPDDIRQLDDITYKTKHYMLSHPSYREELDYIIKPFSKVIDQIRMAHFSDRVACKILWEAQYLHGNPAIKQRISNELELAEIPTKMKKLTRKALAGRTEAEQTLLDCACHEASPLHLFYTREESEEIF